MAPEKKNESNGKDSAEKNCAPSSSQNTPPQTPNKKDKNPSSPSVPKIDFPQASEVLAFVRAKENKQIIKNLQSRSFDEFREMVRGDSELWNLVSKRYVLNEYEYKKQFEHLVPVYDAPSGEADVRERTLTRECSKESETVKLNPNCLVDLFMNVWDWSNCFSDIVFKAEELELVMAGEPEQCHLVFAEFHFPSPLVVTRKSYFIRTCYKDLSSESWAIVDVSLDDVFPNPSATFIKRPSGCLIQKLGPLSGYANVTWLEHVEVDNSMVHNLFKPLVLSGYGYGASRWTGALARQVFHVAAYYDDVIDGIKEGQKNLLSLAEKMTRTYIKGISAALKNPWKPLPIQGSESILVQTKCKAGVGSPSRVIVTLAATIWLPEGPFEVSDFLRDAGNRHLWDLFFSNPSEEIVSVLTDPESKVGVSIIPIIPSFPVIFTLQKVTVAGICTYIVYTPLDMYDLNAVLQDHDSKEVKILSSGFVVIPDRAPVDGMYVGGTLLTISFQIADDKNATPSDQLPQKSASTYHQIMTKTILLIKAALAQED